MSATSKTFVSAKKEIRFSLILAVPVFSLVFAIGGAVWWLSLRYFGIETESATSTLIIFMN